MQENGSIICNYCSHPINNGDWIRICIFDQYTYYHPDCRLKEQSAKLQSNQAYQIDLPSHPGNLGIITGIGEFPTLKDSLSFREQVLDEAKIAITKDRNTDYGEPEDNFADIARMFNVYKGIKLDGKDVAIFCSIIKICRIKQSPNKKDHWVDLAGYSACGFQCAMSEKEHG